MAHSAIVSYIVQQTHVHEQQMHNGQFSSIKVPLTDAQKSTVISIFALYKNDAGLRQQNVSKFIEEWNKQPNLNKLREWWDNINAQIQLTSVGKVLAHSNAQRCDKNLPPFN